MQTDIYRRIEELRTEKKPFAVATVISVRGSTSAKPGSKAIFNAEGKNILGWVGGGCAESFTGFNAMESMLSRQPRIIEADLDDEIFGLAMPCGGKMDIYIEPILPPDVLTIEVESEEQPLLQHLARYLGFEPNFIAPSAGLKYPELPCVEKVFFILSASILRKRELSFASLKVARGIFSDGRPIYDGRSVPFGGLVLLGSSRITEEVAKLAAILGWDTKIFGSSLQSVVYPQTATLTEIASYFTEIEFDPNAYVVVASHHRGDHEFIEKAVQRSASYVGLVASPKRSKLVFDYLRNAGMPVESLHRVFAPAGILMNCVNPSEIALSILTEMILLRRGIHLA